MSESAIESAAPAGERADDDDRGRHDRGLGAVRDRVTATAPDCDDDRRSWTRRLARRAGLIGVGTAAALALATSAAAHVTVSPSSTAPGGYAILTFNVPTESATAATVGLTVQLPTETPFTSVRSLPVPGWTAELVVAELPEPITDPHGNEITEAVTQVVWTATGDGLGPTEFGQFALSVGPLPASGTVYLPAVQAYSDGTTVEWSQQPQGDVEPERPAPSFVIGGDDGDGHTHAGADDTAGVTVDSAAAAVADGGGSSSSGTRWGVAGLVAGVLGLIAGGAALVRTRRP